MSTSSLDPEEVARELIALLGGKEKAFALFEADHARVVAVWEQDTVAIGRILRAHLFVEHFLEAYLARRNPDLGSLDSARLTFAQKAALVGDSDRTVA